MKKIPPPLDDLEYVKEWVKPRISAKRFGHVIGVASSAKKMASKFSNDVDLIYKAELAAWLHDACKETKDTVLVQQAIEYGLELHPIEEAHGHLLHGPVAAHLVKNTFGLENIDVLSAISEHTLGAINMSLLSKIVFLADAVEPGRSADYADPIRQAIENDQNKDSSALNKAILVACDIGLQHLVKENKAIHPRTVEVRNYYLKVCRL